VSNPDEASKKSQSDRGMILLNAFHDRACCRITKIVKIKAARESGDGTVLARFSPFIARFRQALREFRVEAALIFLDLRSKRSRFDI